MVKIAEDIRTLPAGLPKVKLADGLAGLSTEGDMGQETLQAVADTLSQALSESPLPAKKDVPPMPYMDMAQMVRYEHVTSGLKDPLLVKASETLAADDADIQKADFTLKDLHGKKVTLSQLRDKMVLVNFWATWCPPCRAEMPALDAISAHFPSQLVVLSLTNENEFTVGSFLAPTHYHPIVLLDTDRKVAKEFHVYGIPKNFVFDKGGKLVAESIDERTLRQFLAMLAEAGLHP